MASGGGKAQVKWVRSQCNFKSDLFFNMPQGSIITVQIHIKRARVRLFSVLRFLNL